MGPRRFAGEVVGASVVCAVSWLALAVGAGNVGLQRAVSIGPATLAEVPGALALVALARLGASVAVVARSPSISPVRLVAAVLVGDVVGAAVIAPVAIGELTPFDAPVVFVALAALGVQPVASVAGGWLGWSLRSPRPQLLSPPGAPRSARRAPPR